MTEQHRFGYHPDLLAKYPTVTAGAIFARDIDNASANQEVQGLLRSQAEVLQSTYASRPLSSHPHISSWRAAFSSFGVKPTQYRSAVEALMRHVLKAGNVPHINTLVDICNYVSMKHVLPVAAYDLAHVSGPVEVRFAMGDEPFLPLYAKEIEYPKAGEVVYTDSEGALSRRWVWRQCDRAKSTAQTHHALVTTEGVNDIAPQAVEEATRELLTLISQFCGGELSWSLLDSDNPWALSE